MRLCNIFLDRALIAQKMAFPHPTNAKQLICVYPHLFETILSNQGGSVTFFQKWVWEVSLPHTPSQLAEVTNSQLKNKYRILGTLPIL